MQKIAGNDIDFVEIDGGGREREREREVKVKMT